MTQELTNLLSELRIISEALAHHQDDAQHLTMRRNTTISRARAAGAMLEECAQAANLTRQRVWQLLHDERTTP